MYDANHLIAKRLGWLELKEAHGDFRKLFPKEDNLFEFFDPRDDRVYIWTHPYEKNLPSPYFRSNSGLFENFRTKHSWFTSNTYFLILETEMSKAELEEKLHPGQTVVY